MKITHHNWSMDREGCRHVPAAHPPANHIIPQSTPFLRPQSTIIAGMVLYKPSQAFLLSAPNVAVGTWRLLETKPIQRYGSNHTLWSVTIFSFRFRQENGTFESCFRLSGREFMARFYTMIIIVQCRSKLACPGLGWLTFSNGPNGFV